MSTHTCKPDHEGVLADGCERCAEHAARPMLLDLDRTKTAALWAEMVAVEYGNQDVYATRADAEAGEQLYRLSIWLERYCGLGHAAVTAFLQQQGEVNDEPLQGTVQRGAC